MKAKWQTTLLVSAALLGGAAITVTGTATVHAATIETGTTTSTSGDTTTTKTATTDPDQKVKVTGQSDTVDTTKTVNSTTTQNVGTSSAAHVMTTNDVDGVNENGTVQVTPEPRDGESTTTQETDTQQVMNGDQTHYIEKQANGTWQVNTIINKTNTASAGTNYFYVDVSKLDYDSDNNMDETVTLTDGVTAKIQINPIYDSTEYPDMVPGQTFSYGLDGANMMDDVSGAQYVPTTDRDAQGQGFVVTNSPITFHYFVGSKIYTGELVLSYGAAKTTTTTTTPSTGDSTTTKPSTGSTTTTKPSTGSTTTKPSTGSTTTTKPSTTTKTTTTKKSDTGVVVKNNAPKGSVNASKGSAVVIGSKTETKTITPAKTTNTKAATTDPATKPAAQAAATTSTKATLPQTGDNNTQAGVLSLIGAALLAAFGLADRRRRQN